ncbi:uracil-DNA glycosylase family protein [Paenibacillus xerothermodurans]|uniref:Uracil-DNA glycosylase-like domain-containing protein n=1 Tax=Paenibacillus xerothermodurans TaxID=1977292 RepID=A0A2W1NWW9_PAEXE|nr:uracil-DNA glycosylase family protein [Paenibacillus xerothermodurans]PZE20162.1 hypothetical protein CBW46_014835 [Paenibacillus xerothermodurans]
MLSSNLFTRYVPAITKLPLNQRLTKDDLLTEDFLLHQEGKISVYYAPHNEYINVLARVLIVGITPGWNQMELAFRKARGYLEQGLPYEEICKKVKADARFAGSMRSNLIEMLNALELHRWLGVTSCDALFKGEGELLHTTAMLKYPVFVDRRNYTGHQPPLLSHAYLKEQAYQSLQTEATLLDRPLIIPLGKTVESVLHLLAAEDVIRTEQCVWGFPHPSGANGHRLKQFEQSFDSMKSIIGKFSRRNPIQHGLHGM